MSFKRKKITDHIFFWTGIFLFYIFSSTSREDFSQSIETTLFRFPLLMIAAYTFNYWQMPQYFKAKRYFSFALSLLFVIALLVFAYRVIGYNYLDKFCDAGPYPLITVEDFPFYMLSFHFPALIMHFFKINREQELEKEKIYQLEKDKIATELKYLKAQLNPHFLFNTLNNLYSYVINNSPKAPDMILQLSEILDYILYRSQRIAVPLTEEVNIIENYIALERIKYGDRLQVVFEKENLNESQKITPLLLLSIVENAFKHGVRGSIIKPEIKIILSYINNQLEFSVWNTKTSAKELNQNNGIGMENIKRQLDLIYPGKHHVKQEESETHFHINLTLNL